MTEYPFGGEIFPARCTVICKVIGTWKALKHHQIRFMTEIRGEIFQDEKISDFPDPAIRYLRADIIFSGLTNRYFFNLLQIYSIICKSDN